MSAQVGFSRFDTSPPSGRHAARRPHPQRGRLLDQLGVSTLYVYAALALTIHLWTDPLHSSVSGNPHDTDLYTWWLSWTAHQISGGHVSLVTRAMNDPTGVSSMWNTSLLLPGVVLTPLTLTLGAQFSYNLLLFVGFAGSAYTAYRLLLRHANVNRSAATLGGAIFGFSPATDHAAIGHVSLEFLPLVPLLVSAVLDLCLAKVQPVRGGLQLGALAAAQLVTCEEVLFDTAILVLVLVFALALSHRRAAVVRARALCTAGWSALTLFLALAGYPLWIQLHGPLTQHGSPLATDLVKADLLGFITPSGSMLLHTSHSAATALSISPNPEEYLAYLGWPMLVVLPVATVVLWRSLVIRAAGLTAFVAMIFSLGVHLKIHGRQTHVPLPWDLLQHLPLAANVAVGRFALLATLAAGAVVAVVVTKLAPHPLLAFAVATAVVLPMMPLPLPATAADGTSHDVRQISAHILRGSKVLVLPFPTADFTDPMRWQSDTGFRFAMPGGYFIGPAWDGRGYIGGDVPRQTTQILEKIEDGSHPPALTAVELAGMNTDLSYWHVSEVLLGPGPGHNALAATLTAALGAPTVTVGEASLWLCTGGVEKTCQFPS